MLNFVKLQLIQNKVYLYLQIILFNCVSRTIKTQLIVYCSLTLNNKIETPTNLI